MGSVVRGETVGVQEGSQEESLFERFVSVLRTVFDSVVEFDLSRDELTYRFSRFQPVEAPAVYSLHDFLAYSYRNIRSPRDRERLADAFERSRNADANVPMVCRYQMHARGGELWLETTFLRVSENKVVCCTNDVTDRVVAERERAWTSERYRILSELTSAVSFDYDSSTDQATFFFDRGAVSWDAGESDVREIRHYLEGWPACRGGVVHPDDLETVFGLLDRAQKSAQVEAEDYRADYYGKGWRWYRGHVRKSFDASGTWHLIGSIEDVQDAHDLRYRAERDSLTGLLNHGAIMDVVTARLAEDPSTAGGVCVVLDIDDFKSVNDTFGHLYGDEVLLKLGGLLLERCAGRARVGRAGGDEFLLFFPHERLDEAMSFLESLRGEVAAIEVSGDAGVDARGGRAQEAPTRLAASMGVTEVRPADRTSREVVLRADQALYEAKSSGKNRICTR